MKLKDVKKQLNGEIDAITPDVLPRITKTPINRLLSSASPEQIASRKRIMRALAIMFVIFAVATVAVFGYLLVPSKSGSDKNSQSFVSLTFYNLSGGVQSDAVTYGFVLNSDGSIACALNESALTSLDVDSKALNSIVATLPVTERTLCDVSSIDCSDVSASKSADAFVSALNASGATCAVSRHVNASSDKDKWLSFINSHFAEGKADSTTSIDTLCTMYLSVCAKA